MFENAPFTKLVAAGQPTGEVIGVNRNLVYIRGLEGASIRSLVSFENGGKGLVQTIDEDKVTVLHFSVREAPVGTLVVVEDLIYKTAVGPEFIGRVVNPLGEPLDGKGPIVSKLKAAVFEDAPSIIERAALDTQLITGVTVVDALFSFVLGQRIAVLGDSKSGKSTFLQQITQQQKNSDRIIIYALIAKKQTDIDSLLQHFDTTGVMKNAIVVVSTGFDSLALSYVLPYVACAMGEQLWKEGRDTIIMYDDLSNHAKIYRELSLLAQVNPGRDSYPGDIFYTHSSLLERAGKLAKGGGTQTAIPIIVTPNDDITAYLPTNIMSISDGQIIFDLTSFRKGIRPAVNIGLSVSRVGGRVQSAAWQELAGNLQKKLVDYRQALELSQFGSEISDQLQADLQLGNMIYEVLKQGPQEVHDIVTQYLMLATVMASRGTKLLDIEALKQLIAQTVPKISAKTDLEKIVDSLLTKAAQPGKRVA
jgi:F-type H+/Na+-transporting ATPase subunit alpha